MPRAVILFVNRIVDFCRCRLVSDKNALLQVLLASASRSVCTLCLSVLPGRVVREYPLNKERSHQTTVRVILTLFVGVSRNFRLGHRPLFFSPPGLRCAGHSRCRHDSP